MEPSQTDISVLFLPDDEVRLWHAIKEHIIILIYKGCLKEKSFMA
jgi:hypothetical protein